MLPASGSWGRWETDEQETPSSVGARSGPEPKVQVGSWEVPQACRVKCRPCTRALALGTLSIEIGSRACLARRTKTLFMTD